jgi:hypothetical protein
MNVWAQKSPKSELWFKRYKDFNFRIFKRIYEFFLKWKTLWTRRMLRGPKCRSVHHGPEAKAGWAATAMGAHHSGSKMERAARGFSPRIWTAAGWSEIGWWRGETTAVEWGSWSSAWGTVEVSFGAKRNRWWERVLTSPFIGAKVRGGGRSGKVNGWPAGGASVEGGYGERKWWGGCASCGKTKVRRCCSVRQLTWRRAARGAVAAGAGLIWPKEGGEAKWAGAGPYWLMGQRETGRLLGRRTLGWPKKIEIALEILLSRLKLEFKVKIQIKYIFKFSKF